MHCVHCHQRIYGHVYRWHVIGVLLKLKELLSDLVKIQILTHWLWCGA